MLQRGVGRQNRVIRLDDRVRGLWSRVNTEFKFGLLAIVGGKTFQQESTETGSSTTAEGVEDEESLQARAVVSKAADLVHHVVDLLFADGVVTTSI